MKHFDTIKRLTFLICIVFACVLSVTATDNTPFIILDNGDKIILNNSSELTCDNATDGGIISGDQKGCADPTYDPSILSNVSLPSGGSGTLQYIWISTTDDPSIPDANPEWVPIAGSTGISYDPGPISVKTYFQRCARRSGCVDYVAESNYVTITLDCCDNVTDGGTIQQDQSICGTSIDVAPITNVSLPSGGSGDLEYIWLKSTDCSEYFDGNSFWTIIRNSNSVSLDPGVITETTCYIRCARRKGCTDYIGESNIVTVTLNPVPYAEITINSDPKCDNSGKLTATGTGGTPPYSYVWSNGATTSMISNLSGGTYTVVITDANGCTASASKTLSNATNPTATIVTTNVTCSNSSDGMATVTASGGLAPYTYSFSSGTVNDNKASNLGAGTHSVVITDANGCKVTRTFSITKPTPVFVNLIKNEDPKCTNSGKVTANASGGTAPYTYAWNNGASTAMISNLSAGTYTVTATDDNGCFNVQSIILLAADAPSLSLASTNVKCFGNANGIATATATGGTGIYTYSWNNGMTTATISGLAPGTYSVTTTDGNGCTAIGSTSISQPVAVSLHVVGVNATCDNDNGSASASASGGNGGFTYAWSNGVSGANITDLEAGTYTVTATDSKGCHKTASVTINNIAGPSASATGSDLKCYDDSNGTVTLSISGGTAPFTFAWSNGATTQNLSDLVAGTYTVTVTDDNGCTDSASATVTQPFQLSATATGKNATCGDANGSATVTASGGTPEYTYEWSNGATTATTNGLAAGTYTVTLTDDNYCTATTSVYIGNDGGPSVTVTGTNLYCNGVPEGSAVAHVTGGTGTITYLWNNGSTESSLWGIPAGTYSVTVTDANGCKDTDNIIITEPTPVKVTVTGSNETCGNNNGSATALASGGTPAYTYKWSNDATTATITNLSEGSYTVTATDANNCTATYTITIDNEEGPSITAEGSKLECYGDNNGTGWANATGGKAPLTYLWSNGDTNANIDGLTAGTYSVTVTDANGCTATAFTIVTQPTELKAQTNGTDATCGDANGSASVSASGGTPEYTYEWSNGATTATANGLAAGTYTVTVTDDNYCTATASVYIGNDDGPSVTVSNDRLDCFGDDNGSLTATANGGLAPYTYSWSNDASGATISGLSAGTYTVTVIDANGCKATASGTVSQPDPVSLSASGVDGTCGYDNGSASASASGGNGGFTYAWSNGVSGADISGLAAGTYTVTATDSKGCHKTASVKINNIAGPSASATGSDLKCYDDSNGTVTLSISGGTAPFTFAWSNGATTQNLSDLVAGTYTVTVTDDNGCTDSASATVTQPFQLSATATGKNATCGDANGSASVSASGGTPEYTYEWSTGATTATANGLAAGTYTVTVTDDNYCTATASVYIGNDGGPSVTVTGTNLYCNGVPEGSAVAHVTGGTGTITYLWNNGSTESSLWGIPAGTYSVTVTDANGCKDTDNIIITEPTPVKVTVTGSNETCGNNNGSATALASGGTPAYTYKWSNDATTATITNLSEGSYTVTATDANNCTATYTITIDNEEGPSITAEGSKLECYGDNNGTGWANATGGKAPLTYLWSNGDTNANIDGLTAGTYSVTVTDANGCTATAFTIVTQPTELKAQTNGIDATCGDANGSASVSASGGTPEYTYEWSNGATTATANGLAAGTYTVTVTDDNYCTATASVYIGNDDGPSVTVSNDRLDCFGDDNGSLTATANGGLAPYTYSWSNDASGATISGLSAGTYTVTVIDANGCKAIASGTVSQPDPVSLSASGVDGTCGYDNGSASASASGGNGGFTYAWSNGVSGADIFGLAAGTYTVTATDSKGCHKTASVKINNIAGPSASATGSDLKCYDDSNGTVTLSISGGTAPFTFAWSNGATTQNLSDLVAGTYTVTVTDDNGCTDSASATVTQPFQLSATATGKNATCGDANGSATVTASGGTPEYTYEWSNGATSATANGLAAGTYTVTVTDDNYCTATASVYIGNDDGPTVTVSNDRLDCFGDDNGSLTATANGGLAPYTYSWSNDASGATISGLSAGTYTVTVIDANGCKAAASGTVSQPDPVSLSASGVDGTCGYDNGSASASASGGNGGFTYAWSNGVSGADISGLAAGTYTVTATDSKGCHKTASVKINNIAGPSASATGSDLKCYDDSNGTVTLSISGGTAPFTFAWSNGATTQNLSDLVAGTYTVTVTDDNGCTDSASATVTQPYHLSATATGKNATCGDANGSASVTASGGTPEYTYEWSTGATTATANGLAAGTYTVTVTDDNYCTATASVYIGNDDGPSVTVSNDRLDCFGDDNGSLTATANGGLAPYTYSWSNDASGATISGLSAGTYIVTVIDANGCKAIASGTVSQPDPVSLSASGVDGTCGYDNGSASASASGGNGGFTYAWSNGVSGANISGLAAGTYTVTATDSKGCHKTASVKINNIAGPSASATGSDLKCYDDSNGTVTLSISGGTAPFTFAWSNGATTQNLFDLVAGTYTVTVTDDNGCTDSASATVTQPFHLSATTTGKNATCGDANGSASVSASGGTPEYTYEWSNGETTASVSNLVAGTYSVIVTDANGCQVTKTIKIGNTGGPSVSITSITDVSCYEGSDGSATATASGGTPPYSYQWSSGSTSATATGLSFGGYTVTVTDNNGCKISTGVSISHPEPLDVDITLNSVPGCINNGSLTANVTGGTAPYTYSWNTGATGATISGLAGGTYTVMITDDNGCTDQATITLKDSEPGTITVSTVDLLCNGYNNGKATATLDGGQAPIVWNFSGGTLAGNMSSNLAAGSYSVTATDAYGCISTKSFIITEPELLRLSTLTESAGCDDVSGKATVTAQGGTAPYTYLWSTGATTTMITNIAPGSYGITVTDANNCIASGTAVVADDVELICSSKDVKPATCYDGNDGRATAVANGGQGPYTYQWSNGANQATATNLKAGQYTFTITDANGCYCTGSVNIKQPSELTCQATVTKENNGYNTNDGEAKVTASGGNGNPSEYTYAWSNGSNQMSAGNLSPGMYTVTVTDINGCKCESKVTLIGKSQLGDKVFSDLNGNGIQDSGEPGISDIKVTLTNLDDMSTLETTTNGGGMYLFDGLDAGNYKVTFELPDGKVFSPANVGGNDAVDSDANEMGMTETIMLGQEESNLTVDAGIVRAGINVGDYVWIDTDQDGIQDGNEDGIEGIKVTLTNTGDNSMRMTTTGSNGEYLFGDVAPGKYKITFANIPSAYTFTDANQGLDDERDSDANEMGMTSEFMVMLGDEDNLSLDAGIHLICDNVTDAGVIAADQKLCGSYTPEKLTNVILPSGGNGELEYLWLKNETGTMSTPTFSDPNWVVLPLSNGPEYYPGIVSKTTFYVRCARRKGCITYAESNVIKIEICDLPAVDAIFEADNTCVGEVADIEGVNAGPGATYEWSFPSATPSSASTRIVTGVLFPEMGNHDFTLTVTSADGCVASKAFSISIGCNAPVNFQEVNAKTSDAKTVQLDWSLKNQTVDYEYFIEQSTDGFSYQVVGSVKGSEIMHYDFEDMSPKLGTSFYRIKHINQIGEYVISEEVKVILRDGAVKNMFTYPNPAVDYIKLELFEPLKEDGMLYIIDGYGRTVQTVVVSAHTQIIDVDLSTLARGMYFIEVQYDGFKKYRQKVIKALK